LRIKSEEGRVEAEGKVEVGVKAQENLVLQLLRVLSYKCLVSSEVSVECLVLSKTVLSVE